MRPARRLTRRDGTGNGARPAGRAPPFPARHDFQPVPMNDRNLARGLFLMAIALAFGIPAARYPIGEFGRAGPGLFPVLVSSILFLIGVAIAVRSRFVDRKPLDLHLKNIGIIIGSLCGFAIVSMFVNMLAGIVFMVFFATLAGTDNSWKRNVKIALGLVAMAYVLARLLGMNLPLY
jgi:hypothetical protein